MTSSASALIRKGQALRASGSLDAALSAFEAAAAAAPELATPHLLIGATWLQKNNSRKAMAPLRTALALAPNSDEAIGLYAAAHADLKRFKTAERLTREALAKNPNNPKHHWQLGAILAARLRYRAAEKALRMALKINPTYRLALVELGTLLLRRGKLSEAGEIEARFAPADKDHVSVLVFRGKLALRRGDIASARELALWALSRNAVYKPAIALLLQVQARRSPVLGIWWILAAQAARVHPYLLTAISMATVTLIAVPFAYIGFDPAIVERNAKLILFSLIGYLLFGQLVIRRRLKKELEGIKLRPF